MRGQTLQLIEVHCQSFSSEECYEDGSNGRDGIIACDSQIHSLNSLHIALAACKAIAILCSVMADIIIRVSDERSDIAAC